MVDFLVKKFVKNYEQTENNTVRTSYGILSSIVGIICNVLLFAVKFLIGLVLKSMAVTADAFNNLSDAASSIISFVGVKMASKPADKDHPFGHGRMEYIAALIVSFVIIEVGITFLKDSVGKIREPEEIALTNLQLNKAVSILSDKPSIYRRTLVLRVKGYSIREIAQITNSSESNVKTRIHRARAILLKSFDT